MEVQNISRQSLALSQIVRAQVGTGRIALPVQTGQVYAHFKHITGITGSSSLPAYTINQLRSIDNMIDRLKLLKGEGEADVKIRNTEKSNLDSLITSYREQLVNALKTEKNIYGTPVDVSALSVDITV